MIVRAWIPSLSGNRALISPEIKCLATLRYVATRKMQLCNADDLRMSQPSVSHAIKQTINALSLDHISSNGLSCFLWTISNYTGSKPTSWQSQACPVWSVLFDIHQNHCAVCRWGCRLRQLFERHHVPAGCHLLAIPARRGSQHPISIHNGKHSSIITCKWLRANIIKYNPPPLKYKLGQ